MFLCLDSFEHTSVIDRGRNRGGSKLDFLCLDDSERTTRAPLHWLSDSLLLPGRLHIFSSSPDAFFSPPASFSFPWSEGGVGRWEKGSVTSLFHFPFARKCIKSALFPLGAEKNPDWVPWPLLSSRLSFPRVSHRRRFPPSSYSSPPQPRSIRTKSRKGNSFHCRRSHLLLRVRGGKGKRGVTQS